MDRRVKILLIDDQPIIAKAIEQILEPYPEILFHYCQSPLNSIEEIRKFKPTVILQDLTMPDIDGLTLVKYLRKDPEIKEIPLVVLSATEEPQVKAEAFSLGANDYLVKLPDPIEFVARLKYHSESYFRLFERNEAFMKLEESEKALKRELHEAASYVQSLLPEKLTTPPLLTDWCFIPSQSLGGDAFGYQWLDQTHFAFYLLDVCGHGVGAALLSISVLNALSTRSLGEADPFSPKKVLNFLNKSYLMEKHNHLFFTLWYGVIDSEKRTLTYSSGGHPPPFLLVPGELPQELKTKGLAIGALEESQFSEVKVDLPKNSVLLLFSDGAYEILRPEVGVVSYQEFSNIVVSVHADIPQLLKKLGELQKGTPFVDDVSILKISFP